MLTILEVSECLHSFQKRFNSFTTLRQAMEMLVFIFQKFTILCRDRCVKENLKCSVLIVS